MDHGLFGNISTEGNMIDFDTASFVNGRFPQYSNTNKYKANYFGYELLGQKLMIKTLLENKNVDNLDVVEDDIIKFMDEKYKEHLKIRFCDLIGLDYKLHYEKYSKHIDSLCEKFHVLSRKFLPNYYETHVTEQYGNITYLFDFSKFFQKYLIEKQKDKPSELFGMKLLLNETQSIRYEKVGFIKEKIEEFFTDDLVNEGEEDRYILDAMDFIEEYDELFEKIDKTELNSIMLKQYIINSNRNYLYGDEDVYSLISYLYEIKKIDGITLNKIINSLINTNQRNNFDKRTKYYIGLKLYKDFLTYFVISKNHYCLVIEPFSDFDIEFAKATINGEEIMMKHSSNENGKILISEKIEFKQIQDILNYYIKLKINAEEYDEEILDLIKR